jgi:hypothetical protein
MRAARPDSPPRERAERRGPGGDRDTRQISKGWLDHTPHLGATVSAHTSLTTTPTATHRCSECGTATEYTIEAFGAAVGNFFCDACLDHLLLGVGPDDVASIPEESSDHFGCCPICWSFGEQLNIERSHFVVCREHRLYWLIGWNLLGSWRHENADIWQRNADELEQYTEVEGEHFRTAPPRGAA